MKFTASKTDLSNALGRVLGAIEKRSTSAILSNVLIRADRLGLEIIASDLSLYATTQCDARVEIEGEITIPAEKLKSAVDVLGHEIAAELDENMQMILESDPVHFEIACLDADEFPGSVAVGNKSLFMLPAGLLPRYVKAVEHAIARNETKHHLCGIRFCSESGGRLTAVATDGPRLSLAGMMVYDAEKIASGITIPGKACRMISGLGSSINVGISNNSSAIIFEAAGLTLAARLLDGDYPDFRRSIALDGYLDKAITVSAQDLATAIEACGIMSEGEHKAVGLKIDGDKLTLSALGMTGTATATIPCMGDRDMDIKLNSRYLLQATKSLDSTEIFIKYRDGVSPIILIPVDHKSWDERLEALMPLK